MDSTTRAWKALNLTSMILIFSCSLSASADSFVPTPCSIGQGETRFGGAANNVEGITPCVTYVPEVNGLFVASTDAAIVRHQTNAPDRPGNPNQDWTRKVSIGAPSDPPVAACSLTALSPPLSSSTREGDGLSGNPTANRNLSGTNCGNWCRVDVIERTNIVDIHGAPVTVPLTSLQGESENGIYTAIDPMPSPPPSPSPSPSPSGSPSPTPSASPNYIQINVDDLWRLEIDLYGAAGSQSGPSCSREDSLMRGAALQAIKCKQQMVLKEHIDNKGINITSDTPPGGQAECQALADGIMSTTSGLGQGVQSLIEQLGSANAVQAAVGLCRDTQVDPNLENPVQVPCYVGAAEETLKSAFAHLLACETYARAKRAFKKISAIGSTLVDNVRNRVLTTCRAQCVPPKRGDIQSNPKTPQELELEYENCAQSCYQSQFPIEAQVELQFMPLGVGTGGCPGA